MEPDSSTWAQTVRANLSYWQQKCRALSNDQEMVTINEEHHNLRRAVERGLAYEETQAAAAELALQAFPLIERCDHTDLWLDILVGLIECSVVRGRLVEVKLLNCLGILLRQRRQLDAAWRIHNRARELAEAQNYTLALADSLFNLSEAKRLMGVLSEARELGHRALTLFQEVKAHHRGEAATLNTLGLIAHQQRQWDEAERYLRTAVDRWRHFGEPTELGRSLSNLAEILKERGQLSQALLYLQEALAVLAPTVSDLVKVRTQNSLGTIYFALHEYAAAENAFRAANSEALRRSGDYYMRAALAQNLANALLKQNKLEEAEMHIQRAITLWQQIGNTLWLANSLEILAEIMEARGEIASALTYYQEAIDRLQMLSENLQAQKWLSEVSERYHQLKSIT
jgi:tetratricopeptide (TPR) repeat protein